VATQLADIRAHVISVIGDDKEGDEHLRYPAPLVDRAIQYALSFIATIEPPRFVDTVKHRLIPGSMQTAPLGCVSLSGALNVIDGQGNLVGTLSEGIADDLQAFSTLSQCVSQSTVDLYIPTSFAASDEDNSLFFISPPVPEQGEYFVLLSCVVPSEESLCNPKFTQKWKSFYPAILEYVLYTLMAGEDDTRVNDTSQAHFNNFLRLLGISKAIADERKQELDPDD
jgi:hypothetical protein